jgi:hypothetical protein
MLSLDCYLLHFSNVMTRPVKAIGSDIACPGSLPARARHIRITTDQSLDQKRSAASRIQNHDRL